MGGKHRKPILAGPAGQSCPTAQGALGHITALNNKGVVPCFSLGKKRRMKKAKISKTKNSKKENKWILGLNSLADLALQSHKS